MRRARVVLAWLAVAAAASFGTVCRAEVLTTYHTLIGYAEDGTTPESMTLIMPGTVLAPLPDSAAPNDLVKVKEQLKEAYRLAKIEVRGGYSKLQQNGETAEIPGVLDLAMKATLIASTDDLATYRFEIAQKGQALADTRVNTRRGGQAIIGSRFETAEKEQLYLFIVIVTEKPAPPASPDDVVTQPRAIEKLYPTYPPDCKTEGVTGAVVVSALIGKDGVPHDIQTVESPDPRLSEAARQAMAQWRFEPARNKNGKALDARITMTFMFRLQ